MHTTHAVPMQGYSVRRIEPLPGLSAKRTIRVQWDAPYGNGLPITGYLLTVDGADVSVASSADAPQYTVVGLDPGSYHSFAVKGRRLLRSNPGGGRP